MFQRMCIALLLFALGAHAGASSTLLGRVTVTQTQLVPGSRITHGTFPFVFPPTTAATQREVSIEVRLIPLKGNAPIPEGLVKRYDVVFTGPSSVEQKGVVLSFESDVAHALSNGFIAEAKVTFNGFAVAGFGDGGAADTSLFTGSTPQADFNSADFRAFLNRLQLPAEFNLNDQMVDAAVIAPLQSIRYSTSPVYPASKAIRILSGDCGSKANVLEAAYRALGIPARSAVGYCAVNGGPMVPHIWVEAVRNGSWTPVEAANLDTAKNPLRSVGRSELSYIAGWGVDTLTATYKDDQGRSCKVVVPGKQQLTIMAKAAKGGFVNKGNESSIKFEVN